jgi:hypothetical protein
MRARNHSGRRARGAGGVGEAGAGMEAAIVVTGVSGINSAMEKPFNTPSKRSGYLCARSISV